MLEKIDLSLSAGKSAFKEEKSSLVRQLSQLQRKALEQRLSVVVVFEGWDAAGKGTLINELILPLDPRGYTVHSVLKTGPEDALRPFLWRFWIRTPARGRIAVFDRSWHCHVLRLVAEKKATPADIRRAYDDLRAFERQLADDGTVIVKFFLHISKKEQKKRFRKLQKNKATSWRVTKEDLARHRKYGKYLAATEQLLTETDADYAPWTVVEAHDRRFATLKVLRTCVNVLNAEIARPKTESIPLASRAPTRGSSILARVRLARRISRDTYETRIEAAQSRLRELQHEIYTRRIPVVIVYEGWDAAGKGGNLRRLVQRLDPRGYEVIPISAPNDTERDHHYLWRFWTGMPKGGHIAIFDRSWYGRVLVERVEKLCPEAHWRRAYREINEMERHLVNSSAVLLKFWLHIGKAEQLRRFRERETVAWKQWKITDEDWRNRKKWPLYEAAVDEMLLRTSTPYAPWTIVESNCKWYARVKAIETVNSAIQRRLETD